MDAAHPAKQVSRVTVIRQTLYAALLVSVLIYTLLVLCWPVPPAFCIADGFVALRAANSGAALPELSIDELALLCGSDKNEHIEIRVISTTDGLRIRIRGVSYSPRRVIAEVDRASRQFLERAPAYVASRTAASRDQRSLEQEEDCWIDLQKRLQALIEQAEQLTNIEQLVDGAPPQPDAMHVSTGAAPITTSLNPAWVEVNTELETLRSQLDRLLQSRTNAHPEVANVRTRIDQLTRSLDHVPQLALPAASAELEGETEQAELRVDNHRQFYISELRDEFKQLDRARQDLQEAVKKYGHVRSTVASQLHQQPLPLWFAEVARPAALIGRRHGSGPATHPELLLIAVSISLVLAWTARPREPQVLGSVTELQRNWGADVVAILGDAAPTPAVSRSDWTPNLTRMAQWWVLLLLAIFLALAVGDSGFVGNLWHDPAMAIREAWSKWVTR